MDESCPLPTVPSIASESDAGPGASPALEPLRRFHYGARPAELPPVPPRTLPAALEPLRDAGRVRGGWPLLVDPAGGGEAVPFAAWLAAQPLADKPLADNLARIERRVAETLGDSAERPAREVVAGAAVVLDGLALAAEARAASGDALDELAARIPETALLVPYGAAAPARLLELAARRRVRRAALRLATEASELRLALRALLDTDRVRRGESVEAERRESLGALASRLIDSGRLGEVVTRRRLGAPLPEDRRRRLEEAEAVLGLAEAVVGTPLWIRAAGLPSGRLESSRVATDPCAVAAATFEERAAATLEVLRALRLARLETAGTFDPDRHLPGLERLGWRDLGPEELALVPPVLVALTPADLAGATLASLVALLQSGRPVHVLVLDDAGREAEEAEALRFDPALLGVALREVYVHQASPARGEAMARGFERALSGSRPGLHVVDLPGFATVGLDPWVVASARVSGRAAPLFRYEPEAGASWARRLAFADNPQPDALWPEEPLAERFAPGGLPAALPFTYADAALLDPAWREHFAPAAQSDGDLVPIADWLELPADESARRLPFVWGVPAGEVPVRLVVSRALAFACRDRASLWRSLEQLAGFANEHVEQAAERARREAEAAAARDREALAARHAAELEKARAEADQRAVDHLISTLFEVAPKFDRAASAGPAVHDGSPAAGPVVESLPSTEAPSRAQEGVPTGGGKSAPTSKGRADATANQPTATATAQEDAWVDTALCTSCDECTRKYPSIFAYNGDKQAYVTDPRGGSFRDLVQAAEVCTAKVIHPGTPWNPDEPGLDELVTRARAFA